MFPLKGHLIWSIISNPVSRYLLFFFCWYPFLFHAQETSQLQGKITNGEEPLVAAHILNLSKELQTISSENGTFVIPAEPNDTIVMSFLGYKNVSFAVTASQLDGRVINFEMNEDGISLGEVTLEYNKALDPVALGLISKRPPQLSTNERKLEEAGDFKAIQLLGILGGSVPVIPLINKITGRTKRLKERVNLERENNLKEYLKHHYSDYISEWLGFEGEFIDRFLYYAVVNGEWEDIYPGGKKEQFQFRLIQMHEEYSNSLAEDIPEATSTNSLSEGKN